MRGRTIIGAVLVAVAGAAFGAGFAAAPSTHAATKDAYRTSPSCLAALHMLGKGSSAEGNAMQSMVNAMHDYNVGEVDTATTDLVGATLMTKAATEFFQKARPFSRQCRAGA